MLRADAEDDEKVFCPQKKNKINKEEQEEARIERNAMKWKYPSNDANKANIKIYNNMIIK